MTYRSITHYQGIEEIAKEDGITPILIVLGGSSSYGFYNENSSDIDIFCHHVEDEPEFVNIYTSRIDLMKEKYGTPFQFTSESMKKTMAFVERRINRRYYDIFYRIENFLCHPVIYESSDVEQYRKEMRKFVDDNLVLVYKNAVDNCFQKYIIENQSPYINDMLASRIIRFSLTGFHLLKTGELNVNLPELCKKYGIKIDWKDIRTTDKRYRKRNYWEETLLSAKKMFENSEIK